MSGKLGEADHESCRRTGKRLTAIVNGDILTSMKQSYFKIATRLILPLVSLLLFLVIVEFGLRLAGVDTFFQNRFFVLNRALDYPDIFKKDHNLFWRFRPNRTISSKFFIGRTYHINSLGLNGQEVDPIKKKKRLLALGNSCTFGWGVAYENGYVTRLRKLLGESYEVINGAVPGYSSLQGLRFYRSDLYRLRPDIVLILFAFNDHWAAASQIADKDQKLPPQFILDIQNNLARLHTYRLMKKLILSTMEKNPDSLFDRTKPVYRVGPEDFRKNLTALCRAIRSNGARPILLTSPIPSLQLYYPPGYHSGLHRFHARYNTIIREVAVAEGAGLVDLAVEFDKYDNLFDDPLVDAIHFNKRGHKLAAELIYKYLVSK